MLHQHLVECRLFFAQSASGSGVEAGSILVIVLTLNKATLGLHEFLLTCVCLGQTAGQNSIHSYSHGVILHMVRKRLHHVVVVYFIIFKSLVEHRLTTRVFLSKVMVRRFLETVSHFISLILEFVKELHI